MWVVFAIVMGIALIGKFEARRTDEPGPDSRAWREAYFNADLSVVRHAQGRLEFPQLGIALTPRDGWNCLTTTDTELETRPTLVHQQTQLVARLSPFPYANWPPIMVSQEAADESSSPDLSPATDSPPFGLDPQKLVRDALGQGVTNHLLPKIRSTTYQHLAIDWVRFPKYPALDSQLHLGRLHGDRGERLLSIIQRSQTSGQETAIRSLCDQLEWLPPTP